MIDWNDQPPRGGPMVKVKGFPGPLYPPDHAKGPTPDSPLVLAVKRTAARCGAWPWAPDDWDDAYSNRFAHGDGWDDDTHAGVEGLQHWSGTIDATGNVGERTFNFLRSVLVPQGRTHAGEPAMDSVAAGLVDQAYDQAYPPQPRTTVREAALELAATQLGVKENPPGSNEVKYSAWYGMTGPWCAMFCTWAYETNVRGGSPSFSRDEARYAYVPYVVSDARGGRYGLTVTTSPVPGDLVCFDWEGNGEYDHIGLFEHWIDGTAFSSVEGNTSTSNNSNGGEVMRRQRDIDYQGTVFVRVHEP